MVGQHRYEINLKQGDLFISLSSDDLYFISKQMDKWCQVLMDDSYIPISIPSSSKLQQMPPAVAPAYEAPPQPAYAQPPQPTAYVQPQAYAPQPQPVGYVQQATSPVPPQYHEAQVAYQPAPPPVAPLPTTPGPSPAEMNFQPAFPQEAQPVAPQVPVQPVPHPSPQQQLPFQEPPKSSPQSKDEFEVVMDSLMREFEEEPPEASGQTPSGQTSSDLSGISTLLELCDRAQAESSEDYLLLSAYYLTYFEKEGKFSLKRINSMLVKSGLTPVNHSVLEASLGQGHLAMVPDTTGLAAVSEYVLTAEGQQAAQQLFLR